MELEKMVYTMWDWFKGNGNPGASDRLLYLEKVMNGKEDCSMSKAFKEHMDAHKLTNIRRWEIVVGVVLIIVSQVVTTLIAGMK